MNIQIFKIEEKTTGIALAIARIFNDDIGDFLII